MAISCLTFTTAQGQEWQSLKMLPATKHYTIDEGLCGNEIFYALEDRKGYIWVSTSKGVSRFDGLNYENFTSLDGLTDNTIFYMEEGPDGKIWMVGYNRTLCYWEPKNQKIKSYKWNELIKKKGEGNLIDYIYVEEKETITFSFNGGRQGYITIDSSGQIIDKFDLTKLKNYYTLQQASDSGKIRNQIRGLVNNRSNEFKIPINFTFSNKERSKNKQSIFRQYGIFNDSLVLVFEGSQSAYYKIKALYNFNLSKSCNKYKNHEEGYFFNLGLHYTTSYHYLDSILDQQNSPYDLIRYQETFYLCTEQGIQKINKQGQIVGNISNVALSDINHILFLQGSMFILTRSNGYYIVQINESETILNSYDESILNLGIIEQRDTLFFLNFNNEYLHVVDQKGRVLKRKQDENDTYNCSISKPIRIQLNTKRRIIMPGIEEQGLALSFAELLDNKYYTFTNTDRLNLIDLQSGRVQHKFLKGLKNVRLFSTAILKDKIILGTADGLKTVVEDSKVVPYQINSRSFPGKRIQSLETWNNTLVVAVRGEGLFLCTPDTTIHITKKEGLPSNMINKIYLSDNTLWLATNNGLGAMQLKEKGFKIDWIIRKSNGLLSRIIQNVYVKKDRVYIVGDHAISSIKIDSFKQKRKPILLYINEVIVNDSIVFSTIDSTIVFPYHQNQFTFNCTGISFPFSGTPHYEYYMEGLEEQWNQTKNKVIRYSELPPGNYTFKVRGKNDQGLAGNQIKSFSFIIKPPYWRTTWFFCLSILTSIGAILFAFYLYVRNLKKRQDLLREIMIYKSKALSAQMSPHFIFNSLNSIHNFLLKEEGKIASTYLIRFSRLIRFVFENSQKDTIPVAEEIRAVKEYMTLEALRLSNQFDFELEIAPNINPNAYFIPPLIIQPFLENAVWYGIAPKKKGKGKIKLLLTLTKNKKLLSILIEDNGIGRSAAKAIHKNSRIKKYNSGGMNVTQTRLYLANIQDKKESRNYEVIDLKDAEGRARGTRIVFTVPALVQKPDPK